MCFVKLFIRQKSLQCPVEQTDLISKSTKERNLSDLHGFGLWSLCCLCLFLPLTSVSFRQKISRKTKTITHCIDFSPHIHVNFHLHILESAQWPVPFSWMQGWRADAKQASEQVPLLLPSVISLILIQMSLCIKDRTCFCLTSLKTKTCRMPLMLS